MGCLYTSYLINVMTFLSPLFYSAMVGEFLRIARSTLLFDDFLPKARELIHRLKNQGARQHTSNRHLRKIIERHPDDFSHFRIETEDMLNQIHLELEPSH